MTRRLLLATVAAAALLISLAGPAAAGGWAITTLDPLPAGGIAPGRPTPIGYTVRQHGITPVALTDSHLLVTVADGKVLTFPGVPDGSTGHHVAVVTVPVTGHFALATDQGWFADQDLGHLDVGGGAAASAPPASPVPGDGGWPGPLRVGVTVAAGAALLLLGAQLGDRVRGRRGRAGLAGT